MSQKHIKTDLNVKLFIGIMYTARSEELAREAKRALTLKYGTIEQASTPYDFSTYTPYYEEEMGGRVFKEIIVFETLIRPQDIVDIKLYTNSVEEDFTVGGKRQINLDPGYMSTTNIVLVSTKNFTHRIYLDKGIYGELTLLFKKDGPKDFEWTYQDFKSSMLKEFFWNNRLRLLEQQERKVDT